MPVSLSQAAAQRTKSKPIGIFTSYLNLSMQICRQKPTGTAAYLPNDRRLISARPSQSSRRIERRVRHMFEEKSVQAENQLYSFAHSESLDSCLEKCMVRLFSLAQLSLLL